MVDQETTTTDTMTTDAVPATAPDQQQATIPPPPMTAPIDEALRWLANVVTTAGSPDSVDISTTIRQIDVATPDQMIFTRWQTVVGAVSQPTQCDALGATVIAATMYSGLWAVTIRAHVRTTP